MNAESFAAFARRVLVHERERTPDSPRWLLDQRRSSGSLECGYCGAIGGAEGTRGWGWSPVVPFHLGGPRVSENGRLACRRCIADRAGRDLLSWPGWMANAPESARSSALVLRRQLFESSENHLTRAGLHASRATVMKHLEKRWQHPRVRVAVGRHGEGYWVAWLRARTNDTGLIEAGGLLRHAHGATPMAHPDLIAFALSDDRFQEAVWGLIERNALVVDCTAEGSGTRAPTAHCAWAARLPTVRQVHRRRARPSDTPWPVAPAAASTSPRAVALREKRRAVRESESLTKWLTARSTLRHRNPGTMLTESPDYAPGERESLHSWIVELGRRWADYQRA